MANDWNREEIEATVADYLHMWLLEQSGQTFSKADHRRALLPKLDDRTAASIEFKHRNISAVLNDNGWIPIRGYLPANNYQRQLTDVVMERIIADPKYDLAAQAATTQTADVPLIHTLEKILVPAPVLQHRAEAEAGAYIVKERGLLKRNYQEQEARNSFLGRAGEEFVVDYEQRRLHQIGEKKLAEKVELVAVTKGDGLGFDVLSFEPSGRERFIEVKTTRGGEQTPFFISRNELLLSKSVPDQFHLYRVFKFSSAPQFFDLPGAVERHCLLDPVSYVGKFS